jgi:hypothetical protein
MKLYIASFDCTGTNIFAETSEEAKEFLLKSNPQFVIKGKEIVFQWNETDSSVVTIKEQPIRKGVFQVNVFG